MFHLNARPCEMVFQGSLMKSDVTGRVRTRFRTGVGRGRTGVGRGSDAWSTGVGRLQVVAVEAFGGLWLGNVCIFWPSPTGLNAKTQRRKDAKAQSEKPPEAGTILYQRTGVYDDVHTSPSGEFLRGSWNP